jgi:hypothetical protein
MSIRADNSENVSSIHFHQNCLSNYLESSNAGFQSRLISPNLRYPVPIGEQQLYEAALRFGSNEGIDLFNDADETVKFSGNSRSAL